MATLEELSTALVNADKAGDVDAARTLAGEIQKMKSATPAAPESRSVMDQLLGVGGPRHQLPPERLVRGVIGNLYNASKEPGEVTQAAMQQAENPPTRISDSDVSPLGVGRTLDLATFGTAPSIRTGRNMLSAGDVRGAATRGYNSPPVQDLRIAPSGPSTLADALIAAAEKKGLRPDQPGANEIYNRANELRGLPSATSAPKGDTVFHPEISGPGFQMGKDVFVPAPATVQDLTGIRTALGSTIKSGTDAMTGEMNPVAGRASQVRGGITDYLNNIPASDVVSGDPKLAAEILRNAGSDYSASKKLGIIDALKYRAELNAGAANSGQNINNATRQEVKNFIKNQKNSRGLTDEQSAAAERAVMGTHTGNAARSLANQLDPKGALMMSNMTATGAAGGYLGNALGLNPTVSALVTALGTRGIGKVARGIANASEERSMDKFRQTVLNESPSARRSMAWDEAQARKAALVKALLFGGVAQ